MHANLLSEQATKQGLLSSKIRYRVTIQLVLDPEEVALIRDYAPYQPPLNDFLDYEGDEYVKLMRAGGNVLAYTSPVIMEFDSIQQAGKFEDGMLAAFAKYKGQIVATQQRIGVLGESRQVGF